MVKAPKCEVVLWLKKTEDLPKILDEALGLAVVKPFESSEWTTMATYSWRFDSLEVGEDVAEALSALKGRPELTLLRLTDFERPDASVTFKDERTV